MNPDLPMAATKLVPHRSPMLLVDRLVARDRAADTGTVEASLPESGVFRVRDNMIMPEYFIEVAAQTMAAVSGYDALCDGVDHGGGYLVGVDEFRWKRHLGCGERITITVDRRMQVGPVSLIAFSISSAGDVTVAEGVLRTWEAG